MSIDHDDGGNTLADAIDHVRAGRWRDACAAVLDVWRVVYDPELLGVLDLIDARASVPPVRVTPRLNADVDWWAHSGTGDPLQIGALCAAPDHPHQAVMRARLGRLDGPPDPRIARWAAMPARRALRGAIEDAWIHLLEVHGDAGTEASLGVVETHRRKAEPVLAAVRATLRQRAGRVPPGQLQALREALRAPPAESPSLLDAIYANPDDMQLRAVYADQLIQRGDPRGEFIALGLAILQGRATAGSAKRAASLWRLHARDWYAPLAQVLNVKKSSCRAGFLDHMVCKSPGDWDHYAAAVAAANGAACWQTVRSITLEWAPLQLVHVLATPVCRHVQEVFDLDAYQYQELGGETLPWVRLRGRWLGRVETELPEPRFPHLREVTLDEDRNEMLDSPLPIWENVEQVTIVSTGEPETRVWRRRVQWMPRLRRVRLVSGSSQHSSIVRQADDSWVVEG